MRSSRLNVLLVLDAMTGQEAVDVARAFQERIAFDGLVMTKLDGDARGGAALSVKHVTGRPIKLVSVGEKLDQLEWFHPDRMASRILGMGDVLTLIEKAEAAADADEHEEMEKRLRAGEFTFDDFLASYRMLRRMGPLKGVLKMMPGMGKQLDGLDDRRAPDGPGRGDRPLDDSARAARAAPDQRSAPPPHRGGQRHDDRRGEPAPTGPQADGEDGAPDGEGEAAGASARADEGAAPMIRRVATSRCRLARSRAAPGAAQEALECEGEVKEGSWGNHGFPHVEMGKGKLPSLPPELTKAPRR